MSTADEEKQLKAALEKLQNQIDEQKELVKRMLALKQQKIDNEKNRILQLKKLINQDEPLINKISGAEVKTSDITRVNNNTNKLTDNKGKITKSVHKSKTRNSNKVGIVQSNLKVSKQQIPFKQNRFTQKIMSNRAKYYYKNRKFFHGYKFVLVYDDQKLCLVSSAHEFTGKPLVNARSLPVCITLNNKNYIKNAQGDYFLENLNNKYVL